MDRLLLCIALAPPQAESLETQGIVPEHFSTNRIDLSTRAVPVGRPGDVHETGGEFSFSDYKFMQLEISAIGYFRLMETDILAKLKEREIPLEWVYAERSARWQRSTDVSPD